MNSAPIATRHFLHSGNNPAMTFNPFRLLIMTWLPQLQHLALSFAVPYIPTETIARTRNMRISTVTPIALWALETADPSGAKSDPTESATAPTETTTSNLFNCRLVSFVASGNRILSIGIVAIFIVPLHSPHFSAATLLPNLLRLFVLHPDMRSGSAYFKTRNCAKKLRELGIAVVAAVEVRPLFADHRPKRRKRSLAALPR